MLGSGSSGRSPTAGNGDPKAAALKILRWVAFLPAGWLLVAVIEYFSSLAAVWLAQDLAFLIVLTLVFASPLVLLCIVCVAQYFSIYLACRIVCPSPKIGSVIWGTIYYLECIPVVVSIFLVEGGPRVIVPLVLVRVAFLFSAGVAVYQSYTEALPAGSDSESTGVEEEDEFLCVYVTSGGKRYHRKGCRALGSGACPVPVEEAESRGCEPCRICWPEEQ